MRDPKTLKKESAIKSTFVRAACVSIFFLLLYSSSFNTKSRFSSLLSLHFTRTLGGSFIFYVVAVIPYKVSYLVLLVVYYHHVLSYPFVEIVLLIVVYCVSVCFLSCYMVHGMQHLSRVSEEGWWSAACYVLRVHLWHVPFVWVYNCFLFLFTSTQQVLLRGTIIVNRT